MSYNDLKLKCRNCNCILDLTKEETECGCGNCTFELKDGRVCIGSRNGIGSYIVLDKNNEYILLEREEENNG